SSTPLNVDFLQASFIQLSVTPASCSDLSVDARSQEFLRSFARITSELSKSAALLASGPVSFEPVSLGVRVEELKREVARLNDDAVARSKEHKSKRKALTKKVKVLEKSNGELERSNQELVARVSSFENDVQEHAAAIGIRAFALGFEDALKQVEGNYPEVELDRSVFKPPNHSAAKTQPPVADDEA
ncbi:hypothetical protein A2U01_0039465, partial [Trifolium medium]|nr:hypothetical protein [Trifolium medium]